MPFELLFISPLAAWVAFKLLRDCQPLSANDTTSHGLLLFALGYLAMQLGLAAFAPLFLPVGFDPTNIYADLGGALGLQAAAMSAAAVIVLIMARTLPLGAEGHVGMRPHRGPLPLAVGLAAWLAWIPVMFIASLVNTTLIDALGLEVDDMQLIVQSFLSNTAGRESPIVWLSAALIVPIGEEILFRGALQGGLRCWMPPSVAAAVAALVFGSLHDATSMLPVAALGFLLGLLYERTRSLVLPIIVHVLHNTVQLLLLTFAPEALT